MQVLVQKEVEMGGTGQHLLQIMALLVVAEGEEGEVRSQLIVTIMVAVAVEVAHMAEEAVEEEEGRTLLEVPEELVDLEELRESLVEVEVEAEMVVVGELAVMREAREVLPPEQVAK